MPVAFVRAAYASGLNFSLFQLIGKGPLWTVRCGDCGVDFKVRIPMVDSPRVRCTCCGTINELTGLTVGRLGD